MTVRERILTIKLLEKQERRPEYTKQIGIQASMVTQIPQKAVNNISPNGK